MRYNKDMAEKGFSAEVWSLANDVASCRHTPPLQPTMRAVLRVLYMCGEVSSSEMYAMIPCSVEAIRSQLARLREAGYLEVVRKKWGNRQWCYRLSPAGLLSVEAWQRDVVVAAERLERMRASRNVD